MSDLAAAVVWSGIQVSIFAVIVAAIVVAIRKWLGGLVREILTASMALIILFTLISAWTFSVPDTLSIPDWFSVAEWQPDAEPSELVVEYQSQIEPSQSADVDIASDFAPVDWQHVGSETETAIVAAPWMEKVADFWGHLQRVPLDSEQQSSTSPSTSMLPAVAAERPARFSWLGLLSLGILFSVAIGIMRLIVGIVSISRLRRTGTPTTDSFALGELERIRHQLSVRKKVGLTTTQSLATPATVGWMKPVILLPADFDSWSESELSSAIAHELAHVSSGDFGKNLVAQIAVALNFYNPLVHYLGKELRVAQELAADALAASTTVGRKNYLLTMAEMALRQDSKQLGWLAQPFLPTRKTFLRRIEMLKGNRRFRGMRSVPAIWLARLVVLLVAVGCVGFRPPVVGSVVAQEVQVPVQSPPAAQAQQSGDQAQQSGDGFQESGDQLQDRYAPRSQPEFVDPPSFPSTSLQQNQQFGFNVPAASNNVPAGVEAAVVGRTSTIALNKLAYVANKTEFFAAIDFDDLSKIDSLPKLLKKSKGAVTIGERFVVDLEKLIAATLQVYNTRGSRGRSGGVVLHFRELLPKELNQRGETFKYRGQTCIATEDGIFFHQVPQSSTLLMASNRDDLTTMLDSKNGPTIGGWTKINEQMLKRPIVVAASELGFEFFRSIPDVPIELRMFSSLWKDCRCAVAGLHLVDGKVRLDASGLGNDSTAARSVAESIIAAKVVAKNTVLSTEEPEFYFGDDTTQVNRIMGEAVNNITVASNGNLVSVKTSARADSKLVSKILGTFTDGMPMGYPTNSNDNLKRIALAMLNSESAYRKLPAASMVKKGSKYPHSWRIAILPFIEENGLYAKYNFDEPWDSEHNAKVTAKMPDVFRHPGQPRDTKFSAYYLVVGDKTMFPPNGRQVTFGDLSDGASNTIMVVEAKRKIHWAKPEDIAYDPERLARLLGGFTPGKFSVALADGSVTELITENVGTNQKALSYLVEIADGNPASIEDLKRLGMRSLMKTKPAIPFKQVVPQPANKFGRPVNASQLNQPINTNSRPGSGSTNK